MQIGFIGVGVMGSGMAANLLAAGETLTVFDRDPLHAQTLLRDGAAWAESATAAAQHADAVLLSLPTPQSVEAVADAVLPAMARGSALVDLSTSPPALARRLRDNATTRGVDFLDAPVSGGQRGARDGSLAVMVGGAADTVMRLRPVFEAIGANTYHMGDVGAGQTTKLVNNMMCFNHMWSLVEGLALATTAGVEPNLLRDVVSTSSGATWLWRGGTAAILKNKLTPTFDLHLIKKDLDLALSLARELGVPTPLAERSGELVDRYIELGFGAEDIYATIRDLEAQLDVTIRGRWRDPG